MNNLSIEKRGLVFVVIAGLLTVTMATSGCETLRKKFVRKKKAADVPEVEAILDPIDYPEAVKSPEKTYRYHYSLWQVWFKDLSVMVDQNTGNDKKALYNLNQMLAQMEEMKKLVASEKQAPYAKNIEKINGPLVEFRKPSPMRNRSILQSKMSQLEKDVRNNLRLELVQDALIK